jgi:hypothetical protein
MTTHLPKRTVLKLTGNFVQSFIRPNFARDTIEQSVALKARKGGEEVIQSYNKDFKTKTKLPQSPLGKIITKVKSPFALIQFFDIRTAAAVQKTALNELAKTMSLEEAKAEADFIMDLVSGSANLAYRPRIMNSGEMGRALTTFQTFVLNEWGLATQDIIKKGIYKGGANNQMRVRLWAILGLSLLFLQGYLEDKLRNKILGAVKKKEYDDDSFLKSTLLYLPERVPVLGNLVKGVQYGKTGIDVPLISVFSNIIAGIKTTIVSQETKTKLRGLSQAIESVAILFFGLPGAKQAQDIIEGLINEPKSNAGIKVNLEKFKFKSPSINITNLKINSPKLKLKPLKINLD